MLIPKTIQLSYSDNAKILAGAETQLPSKLHTRPASLVEGRVRDGKLTSVTFRTAYDILQDLYLEMTVSGDVGFVQSVWFGESKD